MAISEYRKIQIEQRDLDRKLAEIASKSAEDMCKKQQLLAGSQSKLATQSISITSELEEKYAKKYGKNWRRDLPPYQVSQIETEMHIERRALLKSQEKQIMERKIGGRSLVRKKRY